VLEKREKLLDRKTTPSWATMLADWPAKAEENSSFCDWAVASSELGHRIVALIFRHYRYHQRPAMLHFFIFFACCRDQTHFIIEAVGYWPESIRVERVGDGHRYTINVGERERGSDEELGHRTYNCSLSPIPIRYAELVCRTEVLLKLVRWCLQSNVVNMF